MTIRIENEDNNSAQKDDQLDNFAEYLEYISRTTPTTAPEWMN